MLTASKRDADIKVQHRRTEAVKWSQKSTVLISLHITAYMKIDAAGPQAWRTGVALKANLTTLVPRFSPFVHDVWN